MTSQNKQWFTQEWYLSHYYYGIIAAMLMIFLAGNFSPTSIKTAPSAGARTHVVLNAIATLFFLAQGLTGPRDLLEIPLSWQTEHIL